MERLGHRPALDGLRGIAVVMVMASHLNRDWRGLGTMGVVLFFVLSGFLITTILLEERQRTGAIRLRSFYRRRVLRLVPALGVFVVVATGVGLLLHGPQTWLPALSTVFYVANWTHALGTPMQGFGGMWSLAIEEQFYLVWPLLLILLTRRRWVVPLLAVTVAVMLTRSALATDNVDAFIFLTFATPLRIDALLVGIALAYAFHAGRLPNSRWTLTAAAGMGLALAAWTNDLRPLMLYGFTMGAVASGGLVVTSVNGLAPLTWRPLVAIGRISYGLYLWSGLVMWEIGWRLAAWPWPVSAAILVALSFGLALLSWRYVETPFLRMKHSANRVSSDAVITGRVRVGEVLGVNE